MAINLRRGITKERQAEHTADMARISVVKDANGKIDLNGKYCVITGTVTGMTRSEFRLKLKKKYPTIMFTETIVNDTDYLITGHGIGQTKLTKATRMNIPMIEAVKVL